MLKETAPVKQKGQALILVIVLLATVLTVGISVATRSVINLRDTRNQQESQKAYAAAETGVEKTLLQLNSGIPISAINCTSPCINLSNNALVSSINVVQYPFGSSSNDPYNGNFALNDGNYLQQDRGADIWFVAHKTGGSVSVPDFNSGTWNGSITLDFQTPNSTFVNCDNTYPALALIVVYQGASGMETKRYTYDQCNSVRGNGFSQGTKSTAPLSSDYNWATDPITITNGYFMHVTPLYSSTKVAVKYTSASGYKFPQQGNLIDSTGSSGDTNRKIEVFQGYPQIPSEFYYGLLAPINN